MEPVLMYLLKMFICSAVLYGYYRLALYNENFHQWNRFYLMAAMVLSVVVPFISIPVMATAGEDDLVNKLANMPWMAGSVPARQHITWQDVVLGSAALVSLVFFVRIIVNVTKIVAVYRSHPVSSLQHNVQLIVTQLTQAPFSFFNWLFWRHDIDPASATGQRMLNHELTHIREHHSIDKLFTSLLLCVFWMNPFFWLMRRELGTIHEFLADRKAIGPQDGAAFAEMILQALPLTPAAHNGLVNPFFSTQLKRRLLMITTSKNPKYSYLRRISGLVLMVTSVFVLALSIQHADAQKPVSKIIIRKAPAETTTDTTAKGKATRRSDKMIITSSDNSVYLIVDTIVYPATKNTGEVKVIGYGTVANKRSGRDSMNFNMKIDKSSLFQQKNQPVYIVDGEEVSSVEMSGLDPKEIKHLNVLKGESATIKYGERAKNGVIEIRRKTGDELRSENGSEIVVMGYGNKTTNEPDVKRDVQEPLCIVDGKEISAEEMRNIKPDDIENVTVLKDGSASNKYGERGKNGVIIITTKKGAEAPKGVLAEKKKPGTVVITGRGSNMNTPLFYLNDKAITEEEMKNINPDDIERVIVLKGEDATKKYGEKGKDGVVEITIKKPIT